MKKHVYFTLILFCILSTSVVAQKSDILLTIDNQPITKNEFVRIYEKNNTPDAIDKKTVDEYLEMFINFKLKVAEAKAMKLDTNQAFITEIAGYRKQLAKPYFINKKMFDEMVNEAYSRLLSEVRISHILIKVDPNALPKDTLLAYNKALKIRTRLEKGENFEKVAKETSDDASAKNNGGDLWYLTALKIPFYNIENFMYNAKVGEISMPLKSNIGYHLIKVTDKRKNPGQVRCAHIMVSNPLGSDSAKNTEAKKKIDDIYQKAKAGEDFSELAKHFSDDKGSGTKGGELRWFGTGEMVREFEKAAFALKNVNEFSEPVKTNYGWHIIKLLEKKDFPAIDVVIEDIRNRVTTDNRYDLCKTSVLDKIKKDNNFQVVNSYAEFYNYVDTTIFEGKWDTKKVQNPNQILFKIGNKTVTNIQFAEYLAKKQKPRNKVFINSFVDAQYNDFVKDVITDFEEINLMQKNDDFRYLMQEYYEGTLLFDLTNKIVWTKAVLDTTGLTDFYKKNAANYMDTTKINASFFTYKTESSVKTATKLMKKRSKISVSDSDIVAGVNDTTFRYGGSGIYRKGENEIIDHIFDGLKNGTILEKNPIQNFSDKFMLVYINQVITPQPKPFEEVKGLVTAKYQDYLEEKWVKELREKYKNKISVNQEVLNSIKSK